jgi:hypothetical protein
MRLIVAAYLSVFLVVPAIAQQSAPPSDQPAPPAAAAPSAAPSPDAPQPGAMDPSIRRGAGRATTQNAKRAMCVNKLRAQGLRGRQMRDSIQLCLAEARVSCLKQAIAQKLSGAARKDFLKSCTG